MNREVRTRVFGRQGAAIPVNARKNGARRVLARGDSPKPPLHFLRKARCSFSRVETTDGCVAARNSRDQIDRLAWGHRQPHRNKPIFCHSQIAMHVLPSQFLREPHQHRPVWSLAHILGSFFGCRLTAATAADKRTHVNSVLARPLPAYAGDERRIAGNCDAVSSWVGSWDEAVVKSVWGLAERHGGSLLH
jgi:hypothetical protein